MASTSLRIQLGNACKFNPFSVHLQHRSNVMMHYHTKHELYYAVEDGGHQHIKDRVIEMKKADLYFYPAGMLHWGNGPVGGRCLGYVINFRPDLFSPENPGDADCTAILDGIAAKAVTGIAKVADSTATSSVKRIFEELIQAVQQRKPAYMSRVKHLLMELLCNLAEDGLMPAEHDRFRPPTVNERVREVCAFIDSRSEAPLDVNSAAEMANMSRSYFQAKFREETGKTFTEYLNLARAKNAYRLLKETGHSLASIASMCGFGSVSNFYLIFRKEIGIPPKAVRRSAE